MEALHNLTSNIPDWQRRLDELSSQIALRQIELGALAAQEPHRAEVRSLRNKGSTESLKPADEGPVLSTEPAPTTPPILRTNTGFADDIQSTQVLQDVPMSNGETLPQKKPSTPVSDGKSEENPTSPGAIVRKQAREAMLAAHAKNRAQMRRRQRSSSAKSGDAASPSTYRTRSMIIVYYDSYVQGFFDELVRFVSASRNMMRKAKMAAKVAQIKRMAEADSLENDDVDGNEVLPSLRYMSTRRFGNMGFGPSADHPPDIYDKLDKSLETVQMSCEHGAHQFLRDAECNDELERINKCLIEVLDMAAQELERVDREEPEAVKEIMGYGRPRTQRPIAMRRDLTSTTRKDSSRVCCGVIEPATPVTPPDASAILLTSDQPPPPAPPPMPTPLSQSPGTKSVSEHVETPTSNTGIDSSTFAAVSCLQKEVNSETIRAQWNDTGDKIQVDDVIQADDKIVPDEGIDMDFTMPKLMYRSTRGMRGRGPQSAVKT